MSMRLSMQFVYGLKSSGGLLLQAHKSLVILSGS
jgi:hypothetical protein